MPGRLFLFLLAPLTLLSALATASKAAELIPDHLARRNGVERAWFSQVQLNPARNEVESVVLDGDTLVALSTAGVVHAMHAETGQTLWTSRIGNPEYPSLGPAIGGDHVAVVNGSTLYVLDRLSGAGVLSKRLGGGAGGGPAISKTHAFVPLFSGRIEGYNIADPTKPAWYYTSSGRIFARAEASSSSVAWNTDQSRLYVARDDASGIRFRFESGAPIVASATVRAPRVYAASMSGNVFALDEDSGQQQWRYSSGFAVTRSPVVIGETLYVVTEEPTLHAIEAATGRVQWVAQGVAQFIAASKSRVYCVDGRISGMGGVVALDRKSGAAVARAAGQGQVRAVLNDQTDRLYLYSRDGLVQCLHEIGADEPHLHRPVEKTDEKSDEDKPDADQPTEDLPDEAMDAPTEPDPFGGDTDPFAPQPADDAAPDDADPFGGGDDPFGGLDDPF